MTNKYTQNDLYITLARFCYVDKKNIRSKDIHTFRFKQKKSKLNAQLIQNRSLSHVFRFFR